METLKYEWECGSCVIIMEQKKYAICGDHSF